MADPDTAQVHCRVCRGTHRCTFCTGAGYLDEHGKLSTCGVCVGTGACSMCGSEK